MRSLTCPRCRFTLEGAAAYARIERCPRCASRLGRARSLFERDPRAPAGQSIATPGVQRARAALERLRKREG